MVEERVGHGGRRRMPDVFTVIGDPTKRRILEMTREREWCVNELVESLEVSQPAISKHLRSLREAGLVQVRVDGQRRWYRLRDEQMEPLQDWVRRFSSNGSSSGVLNSPSE
jgi:DNA-binding transcriptional ArsR family regulator